MKLGFGRSAFIAGAAAGVFFPRALAAQSLTVIRIGATPQGDIVGALYAQANGTFQKNGIDVQVIPMNNGAAITAAILGGSLEFGKISMLNLVQAHARGIPLVIECPAALYGADIRDAIGIIVAKDSPIRSGRDLNGKTFAVPALGDLFTIVSSTWIDKTGGDSSTVKFLELPGKAAAEAIASGRVDAATLAQPTLKDAVAGGKFRILADPFAAVASHFVSTAYACSVDFATKNAAAVARFRKIISDANTYANKHVAEMLPLISKFTGIDLAVLDNLPFTRIGTTAVLKDAHTMIQPLIDVAVKYKAIPHSYDAKELIDPAALA
jgi:NitT/TauT family transport system substrate-binding protein